jgi:hypothetical protein
MLLKRLNTMLIKRTKLINFKGNTFIDLRSYEVDAHLKRKATARVIYGDEYMDISPVKLKRWTTIDPQPFDSKINAGQVYYLRSYLWKPIGKISPLTVI